MIKKLIKICSINFNDFNFIYIYTLISINIIIILLIITLLKKDNFINFIINYSS